MNQQEHDGAYRAAIEAAMDELNFICQELERLRNRQYQFEAVAKVLKPLIGSGEQSVIEDRRRVSYSMEAATEPGNADESTLQSAEIGLPQFVSQKKSESADPFQRQIDSILGLALA